jgi:hypothetical protein
MSVLIMIYVMRIRKLKMTVIAFHTEWIRGIVMKTLDRVISIGCEPLSFGYICRHLRHSFQVFVSLVIDGNKLEQSIIEGFYILDTFALS